MSFDGSAALMNVAGKEGEEVKREGELKLPWKRALPGPAVGFQRTLIMAWMGHWLEGGHIFNTKQTPERVCLLTNEEACSDSLYVRTIFGQVWRMCDPYECGVFLYTWIVAFISGQNMGIWKMRKGLWVETGLKYCVVGFALGMDQEMLVICLT